MKHCRYGLICLLVLALLLPMTFPATAVSGGTVLSERYGYSCLHTDAQRYVYDALATGVLSLAPEIVISEARGVTREDLRFADEMFRNDHPEVFWYMGEMSISFRSDTVCGITPRYVLGEETVTAESPSLIAAREALDEATGEILSELPDEADTPEELALWLHDRLAERITYVSNAHDQTAYGALVLGEAVCAGYARAYQWMLQVVGVRAWTVYGTSRNPETGETENHAWNLVFQDGACYYTDLTWNDQGETIYHVYYERMRAAFDADHEPEADYLELLPICEHEPRNYYASHAAKGSGIGVLSDAMTGAEAAEIFPALQITEGKGTTTAVFRYEGTNFSAWLQEHRKELSKALGLEGTIEYSYLYLGREYHITVTGNARVIPLEALFLEHSEWTLTAPEEASLSLRYLPWNTTERSVQWTSSDESVLQVTSDGRLLPISNGVATVTVRSESGAQEASCRITVDIPLTEVSQIAVTNVAEPAGGGRPQSAAQMPPSAVLTSLSWQSSFTGSEESYLPVTDRFAVGRYVRLCIRLRAAAGYSFAESCTATVNGAPAELLRTSATEAVLVMNFGTVQASEQYTVIYAVGEGAEAAPAQPCQYPKGSKLLRPVQPYAEGRVFMGWYTDPAMTNEWSFFADTIEGNLVLFARWRDRTDTDHVHDVDPQPIAERAASCTSAGTREHYRCRTCEALFLDAAGHFRVTVAENLLIPPVTEHQFEHFEPHSGGHYAVCIHPQCNERAEGGTLLPHRDENHDGACDDCAYRLTPRLDGSGDATGLPSAVLPTLSALFQGSLTTLLLLAAAAVGVVLLVVLLVVVLRKKK